MNVYTIEANGCYEQTHCVVAESMGEAERVFNGKYWPTEIKSIKLYSSYVQIQKYDEQSRVEIR
jgi:hypothetical protein